MPSFSEILSKPTVFRDRNVLSPSYIPGVLPFREKEIELIMVGISPALRDQRPKNIFVYGKTGTGKTASVKHVMKKFEDMKTSAQMFYVNCKIYNSRYRVIQRIAKTYLPETDKAGFGLSYLYEKLLEWISADSKQFILVLDEIDMIKDLDDLVYTLTRSNDDLKRGSVSMVGISNKLDFKDVLDPRSKSSLSETEMVFAPYKPEELQAILRQRTDMGFRPGAVEDSAINLAAAIAAQETGDARYALRLLLQAGEIADAGGRPNVTDKDVEAARRSVDENVAMETIGTLPEHQKLVLYAVANLTIAGSRYAKLAGEEDNFLLSGEVYEEYSRACRHLGHKKRSARWYRVYLNDLEMLGLITTVESGKGIRGHTRLIKIGHAADEVKKIVENDLAIVSGKETGAKPGLV